MRRWALDGGMAIDEASRNLIKESLAVADVRNDHSGNVRLQKRTDNLARDDVAAALVLLAGSMARLPAPYHGPPVVFWD